MNKRCRATGRLTAIACFLILLPALAGATTGQDLFEAEVPVSSQQPGERTTAMKTALARVLVRVTGQRSLPEQGPARSMLEDPNRFVQQYRYFTVPDSKPPRLMLRVRFDGDGIRQALRQQGASYWGGSERPDTLIWLAVEEQGRRTIVSAEDSSVAYGQIQQAARQRGVPLLFPLMDLEDQSRVRFGDIWGGFFDQVLAASDRYNPQAVLIGRLNRGQSGSWMARWDLQVAGKKSSWSDSNIQLDKLLQAGIDNVADKLASSLAVTGLGADGSRVKITVEDINTLGAYARVNDYLSSLTTVRQLQVEQVSGSTVTYGLQLNGSLQGLTRTIAIGTVLESSMTQTPGSYRLRQ